MPRILIVDDEPILRGAISRLLRQAGYSVDEAENADEALNLERDNRYDLLVLDVALPGQSGVQLLRLAREVDPSVAAIFITAHGSIRSAVDAIRAGGYDYLTKPFDNDLLLLTIERALDRIRLSRRVEELEQDLTGRIGAPEIVGQSKAIQESIRLILKAAKTDATVLLHGESGTGKELAAKAIHRLSERAAGSFVALNCGAIPSNLAESVLFGHERGAFTDAKEAKRGQFELAHKGTIFLDEVAELPSDVQVKLLRVLQEREVVRIGADRPTKVDVRVLAATNLDLTQQVRAGRFREDLFWRLNVLQIHTPPLRSRRDDIPLLVDALLDRVNAECRTRIVGLTAKALGLLKEHHWSGNVRELANVLRHAAIMTETEVVDVQDLPPYLRSAPVGVAGPEAQAWCGQGATLEEAMAATERQLLEATLLRFEGNRTAAAAALGIDRRTLYNKIESHGLQAIGFAERPRRR